MASTSRAARSFGAPRRSAMRRGLALRRQQRAAERLADVDVAEPRDDPSGRAARPSGWSSCRGTPCASMAASNALPSGSGPSARSSGSSSSFAARHELHRAEAARIVEAHRRARRHVEHHMVVRQVLGAVVIIRARRRPSPAVALDAERARHAEMHHQHVAGRQIGQQIFRAPAEPADGLALRGACTKSFGSGQRRSPRCATTLSKRAPSITGASPRRTVSTSGSSGIQAAALMLALSRRLAEA